MKKCNYCNTPCEDNQLFCPNCGKPLPSGRVFSKNASDGIKKILTSNEASLFVFTLTACAALSFIGGLIFSGYVFNLIEILLCVAAWLVWAGARRANGNRTIAANGFSIVRIVVTIMLVLVCVGFGLLSLSLLGIGITMLFAGTVNVSELYAEISGQLTELRTSLLSEFSGYSWYDKFEEGLNWATSEKGISTIVKYLAAACFVLLVIVIALLILYIFYFKTLRNYCDASNSALAGGELSKKKLSSFPVVILVIGIIGNIVGIIADVVSWIAVTPSGVSFLSTCISALSTVMLFLLVRMMLSAKNLLNPEIDNKAPLSGNVGSAE